MTYYLVRGTRGEYSERTEWSVALYADEAQAQAHVARATRCAEYLQTLRNDWDACDEWDPCDPMRARVIAAARENPFDPPVLEDHPCGVEYAVYELVRSPACYWYEAVDIRSIVPDMPEALKNMPAPASSDL